MELKLMEGYWVHSSVDNSHTHTHTRTQQLEQQKHTVSSEQYPEWTHSSIWYWVWGRQQKARADGKYRHCELCCGLSALSHTRDWSTKAELWAVLLSNPLMLRATFPPPLEGLQDSTGSHSLHWEELMSNSFFTAIAKQLAKGNWAFQGECRFIRSVFKPLNATAVPT